MDARSDLLQRFGQEAADRMTAVMGTPNIGDPSVQPAAPERALGALMGVFKCKVSGGVRHDWHASTEMDLLTQLTLVTADSLIAGTDDHPARLAARLVGFDINTTGTQQGSQRVEPKAGCEPVNRGGWQARLSLQVLRQQRVALPLACVGRATHSEQRTKRPFRRRSPMVTQPQSLVQLQSARVLHWLQAEMALSVWRGWMR